jgi:putative ABC transport system ATP-binding protein
LFEVPVVLIADEPTGNLDESNSAEVMALLYSLPTLVNCSLLVVTHDRLVAGGADRAIELTHGRISSIVESASDENCEA